jgi:muramoyltetrapeptide carboxypeptidase
VLLKVISYKNLTIKINDIMPLNKAASTCKHVFGKLTGGNLSIIQTSIGTKWQIKTDEKILFLEDVNVKPYQVDRMLYHMLHAGLLKNVKGIVFGNFSKKNNKLIYEVIKAFAEKYEIPMYKTSVFGHGHHNIPMIYNSDVDIYIQSTDYNNEKIVFTQRIFPYQKI